MKIAMLSGKGGTGKTFVSVNLAVTAGKATYIDCDVEEPNGNLFLKANTTQTIPVTSQIPSFDAEKCNGCRACVRFCQFHALVYLKQKPMLFSDVCHSCGGCELVCPTGAVGSTVREVGQVEVGDANGVRVVTGLLRLGEASAVPVIRKALQVGGQLEEQTTIIDCPPGSSCAVIESVQCADYCVVVVEPTAFGFHNFKMVQELLELLGKPYGVVVNKATEPYEPLETFCHEHQIDILLSISYQAEVASKGAVGGIAVQYQSKLAEQFKTLLNTVKERATQ